MNRYFLLCSLFLLFLSSQNLTAKTYSEYEINQLLLNETTYINSKKLIKRTLLSQSPIRYIETILSNHTDPIAKEYFLFELLQELSKSPPQKPFSDLVSTLKKYQVQANKHDEESHLLIPVFNIKARASGLENYWKALEIESYFSQTLNKTPLSALDEIRELFKNANSSEWIGLNNSIGNINQENQQIISNHFLQSPQNLLGLEYFYREFVLKTHDFKLLEFGISNLDNHNREYLLRSMQGYFEEESVSNILLYAANSKLSQKFALSLMKPLVNSDLKIKKYLLTQLSDKEMGSSVAFSLSALESVNELNKLMTIYKNTKSEDKKNNVLLALRFNKNSIAQSLYKQIKLDSKNLKINEGEL